MHPPRHAVVIGAGPAGTTAAACLARRGWRVTLLEAARLPRDKVCGGCLSALGTRTLRDAGLGDALDDLSPVTPMHAALHASSGRLARFPLPAGVANVTRRALDHALARALPPGVTLHQNTRVTRVEAGFVHTRGRTLHADAVVVADGKGTLPGLHIPPFRPPRPTGDLGLQAHFAGVDLDPHTIHLFALRGHYVGVALLSDGPGRPAVWNVAMNVPARRLVPGQPHDTLWTHMLVDNPSLTRAFAKAAKVDGWRAAALPRFAPVPSRRWPTGVFAAGNAAAALEPIGGEGMGLAVASAAACADVVASGRPASDLDAAYRRLWRTRRCACRLWALALSGGWTSEILVAAASLPRAARLGVRLAGKTATSPHSPSTHHAASPA